MEQLRDVKVVAFAAHGADAMGAILLARPDVDVARIERKSTDGRPSLELLAPQVEILQRTRGFVRTSALGHPTGASLAHLVVTLLGALRTHGLMRAIASRCIGGDEATAIIEGML